MSSSHSAHGHAEAKRYVEELLAGFLAAPDSNDVSDGERVERARKLVVSILEGRADGENAPVIAPTVRVLGVSERRNYIYELQELQSVLGKLDVVLAPAESAPDGAARVGGGRLASGLVQSLMVLAALATLVGTVVTLLQYKAQTGQQMRTQAPQPAIRSVSATETSSSARQ